MNREQASPPNAYPLSRQMLGRYAPGICRAGEQAEVTGDVDMVAFLSTGKVLPSQLICRISEKGQFSPIAILIRLVSF